MSSTDNADSAFERVLFIIASLSVRFFSESTRDWAQNVVENLDGDKIREITREEIEELDSVPERTMMVRTEDDANDDLIKIFSGDERTRGLTAIVIALKYRLKQYSVIFLVPVILYLIRLSNGGSISLINVGIYFDLFGAIIVVRGLYRTPAEVDYESAFTIPENPLGDPVDRLVAAVETVDSMFGSSLLTLGFAFQLVAVSNFLFAIAVILLILIVWLGLR